MFRIIFSIALLVISCHALGQTRKFTLVIDTVKTNETLKKSIMKHGLAIWVNSPSSSIHANDFYIWLPRKKSAKTIGYVCTIELASDSDFVQLPIDEDKGKVELYNVYRQKSDTIHIQKLEVFTDCVCDTLWSKTEYYYLDSVGKINEPYDIKNEMRVFPVQAKNCLPQKIGLTINTKTYSAPVNTSTEDMIQNAHGYLPKEYLENRETYKGKVTYFHTMSHNTDYENTAKIILE